MLDPGGCAGENTLRLCEQIRNALSHSTVRGRVVAPTFRENLADTLALLARQGYKAVTIWGLHADPPVAAVARRYPDVRFAVIDGSRAEVPNAPPNIQGIVLRTREAAFLAGWLAAKLEARRPGRDTVGVVGGIAIPQVTEFVHGFVAGAKRATPRVKVLVDYSDDFLDASKCAALARRQIARGAGVVFNVAGGCGLGTMKAAADAGVWAVGVDSDQSSLGPHVLTSVLKSFEAGFAEVLRQVEAKRVRTGRDTVLTMRDGAAGLGRISPKVPRSLAAQVEELRRRIVAGTVRVPGIAARDAPSDPPAVGQAAGSGTTTTHRSPSWNAASRPEPPVAIRASTAPVFGSTRTTSGLEKDASHTEPSP